MLLVTNDIDSFLTSNALNIVAKYDETNPYIVADLARESSRIYKSIINPNLDNYPPNNVNKFWIDWEASNEYAMLDLYEATLTNFAVDGIVTFNRGTKEVIAIGNFNAREITVEYLDDLDAVLDTETYLFPHLGKRIDDYSYIYADFEKSTSQAVYRPLQRLGTKIRVTLKAGGLSTYCGFLVAGKAIDMGKTLDKVNFKSSTVGYDKKRVASFNTMVKKTELIPTLDLGDEYHEVPMLFVIDPSENSSHQNMVTIAKITQHSGDGENMEVNTISWEITQN